VRRLDALLRRPELRLTKARRPIAAGAIVLAAIAAALSPALGAERAQGAPWADAALGYLLRTDGEFPIAAAIFLRAAGQLAGDARAVEIAEIRRIGSLDRDREAVSRLFELDLQVFTARLPPHAPESGPPTPAAPDDVGSPASRPPLVLAPACLARAARCALEADCLAAAVEPNALPEPSALWLLFVRWASCKTTVDVDVHASRLAGRLLAEQRRDPAYSTTSLLRLATLGQLGYADRFDPKWVRTVLDARSPQGCWGAEAGGACHPHPTALALWVLALAEHGGGWSSDLLK
jgi:hypothetical protein